MYFSSLLTPLHQPSFQTHHASSLFSTTSWCWCWWCWCWCWWCWWCLTREASAPSWVSRTLLPPLLHLRLSRAAKWPDIALKAEGLLPLMSPYLTDVVTPDWCCNNWAPIRRQDFFFQPIRIYAVLKVVKVIMAQRTKTPSSRPLFWSLWVHFLWYQTYNFISEVGGHCFEGCANFLLCHNPAHCHTLSITSFIHKLSLFTLEFYLSVWTFTFQ